MDRIGWQHVRKLIGGALLSLSSAAMLLWVERAFDWQPVLLSLPN